MKSKKAFDKDILLCILAMIFRTKVIFSIFGIGVMAGDILMVIGMVPMYYEMVRMAIALFRRLKEFEK